MEIIEVEKKKMEALQSLAEIGMKISEARDNLSKIDQEKDLYFQSREAEIIEKIADLLAQSQSILVDAGTNFDQINSFAQSVSAFSDAVISFHDRLIKIQELFAEKADTFNKVIEIESGKIKQLKTEIALDRIRLQSDDQQLISREKKLVERETKVKDLEEMVHRDIIRFKEGRI